MQSCRALASRFCHGFSAACSSGRKGCRRRNLVTTCSDPVHGTGSRHGGVARAPCCGQEAPLRISAEAPLVLASSWRPPHEAAWRPLAQTKQKSKCAHSRSSLLRLGGGASLAPPIRASSLALEPRIHRKGRSLRVQAAAPAWPTALGCELKWAQSQRGRTEGTSLQRWQEQKKGTVMRTPSILTV